MIRQKAAVAAVALAGMAVSAAGCLPFRPEPPSAGSDLTWIRPPASHSRVVIFVHGFGSNSDSAWLNENTGAYWPALVRDDPDFDDYAILAAGYRSPRFRRGSDLLSVIGRTATLLTDEGVFDRFQQVHFVGHSTGGLVIRGLLGRLNTPANEARLAKVTSVLSMAVPTSGAPIAAIQSYISLNPQIRNLDPRDMDNSVLRPIDMDWEQMLRDRVPRNTTRPRSFCAIEAFPTYGVTIAPELYTRTICDEERVKFDRDHINLVKPAGRDDDVYKWAKVRLLGRAGGAAQLDLEGGLRLGEVLSHLAEQYAKGNMAEQVRLHPAADPALINLWIGPGSWQRPTWGQLFEAVAVDHPCLLVTVDRAGTRVMLSSTGSLKAAGPDRTACGT